jgi:uncharacterized membrane protein YeaQ/YmgE (transglycosylase-associated protein family)
MQVNLSELILIIIILLAGILGGSVNYITEKKEDPEWKPYFTRVIVGIAGAFLMPLFLETLSSDLVHRVLMETDSSTGDIFVLFGFCLIGSISSRALMRTLSDKILQEVKDAKETVENMNKKVEEIKSEIDPIVDQATEQDEMADDEQFIDLSGVLTKVEISILEALIHPKYTLRSKTGISKETGLGLSEVIQGLSALKEKSLAAEVQGRKGPRWSMTSTGHKFVASLKEGQTSTND